MPKLSLAGDGITVEYLHSTPHPPDPNPELVVSLGIAHEPIASQRLASHLSLTVNPDAIEPHIAEWIQSVPFPFIYSHTVSNPSILHLLHLLPTEMQLPQLMDRMFVSTIVTVLLIYLLQHWQAEHSQN